MKTKSIGKHLILLVTLVFTLSMFLSACSSGDSSSGKANSQNDNDTSGKKLADKQVLKLTADGDIGTIDSAKAGDAVSMHTLMRVSSGLVAYNGKDELVPELAKKLPKGKDNNTKYVFKLRDAKWSDGSPITAQQFVYAWHRSIDPKTKSPMISHFEDAHIKNAAKIIDEDSDIYGQTKELGVKAKDKHTLVVKLSEPTPPQYFYSMMQLPTLFPLKKEFVKKQGDDYAQESDKKLYSGPFKLKKWDHGSGWKLVKNDKYWNADKITLDKVNYKIVTDPKTELKLYNGGKIDFTKLSSEDVNKYKDDKEFKTAPDSAVYFWQLNRNKVDAFKNKKLRQAMWLSIDRKAAVDVVLNNGSMPANYLVPKNFATGPNGKSFHKTGVAKLNHYPGKDKEKAKQLWKEAKEELGIDKLNLDLKTSDGEKDQDLSEYYVNQITKNLDGLNIKISKLPSKSLLSAYDNGNYEMISTGGGPTMEDPMTFLGDFESDSSQNTWGFKDKKYDGMLDKAKQLGDQPKKRWEVLQKADHYLAENAELIPLYQEGKSILYKSYVKDYDLPKKSIGVRNYYRYVKIMEH